MQFEVSNINRFNSCKSEKVAQISVAQDISR